MPKLTATHARTDTGAYRLAVDAPDDDLAAAGLETDGRGRAVFEWPADPPPKTGRRAYEAMQQREAALLVKDALARQPAAAARTVAADLDLSDVD